MVIMFKIDLIVWKLYQSVYTIIYNIWFKIDLIVWKYTKTDLLYIEY